MPIRQFDAPRKACESASTVKWSSHCASSKMVTRTRSRAASANRASIASPKSVAEGPALARPYHDLCKPSLVLRREPFGVRPELADDRGEATDHDRCLSLRRRRTSQHRMSIRAASDIIAERRLAHADRTLDTQKRDHPTGCVAQRIVDRRADTLAAEQSHSACFSHRCVRIIAIPKTAGAGSRLSVRSICSSSVKRCFNSSGERSTGPRSFGGLHDRTLVPARDERTRTLDRIGGSCAAICHGLRIAPLGSEINVLKGQREVATRQGACQVRIDSDIFVLCPLPEAPVAE